MISNYSYLYKKSLCVFIFLVGCQQQAYIRDSDYQTALNLERKGNSLNKAGKKDDALNSYLKAYEYFEKNQIKFKGNLLKNSSKINSVGLAKRIGEIYEELGFLDKAEQIYQKCNSNDAQVTAYIQYDCRPQLVILYQKSGRKALADKWLESDPTLQQSVDYESNKNQYDNPKKQSNKAFVSSEELTDISFFDSNSVRVGKMIARKFIADEYKERGDYLKAEGLYKQVIDECINNDSAIMLLNRVGTYNIKSPTWVSAIPSLAEIYLLEGRFSDAIKLYKQLSYLQKDKELEFVKCYGSKSKMNVNYCNDQYDMGFDRYTQAEISLAGIDVLQGHFESARKSLNSLRHSYSKKIKGEQNQEILDNLENTSAWLYQMTGEISKVTSIREKQLRFDNLLINQAIWGLGNVERQAFIKNQSLKHNILWNHYLLTNSQRAKKEAIFYSLSRKGILQKTVSEINATINKSIEPHILDKAKILQKTRARLAGSTLLGGDVSEQLSLQSIISSLETTLARDIQKTNIGRLKISPEQVIKKLSSHDVVIDFHIYRPIKKFKLKFMNDWSNLELSENDFIDEHLVALVITKDQSQTIDLGPLSLIEKEVKNYRNKIKQQEAKKILARSSKKLYKQILFPIQAYINNKKKVYIIADGVLHLLPFKGLQNDNGKYLAQLTDVIKLNSVRDIVLETLQEKAQQSAIFASPLFQPDQEEKPQNYTFKESRNIAGTLKNIYFSPLPGTLKEGKNLYKLMKKYKIPVNLFSLSNATEKAVKSLKNPKILHLATHGYYLAPQLNQSNDEGTKFTNDPLLRSGLAFSNANIGIKERQDKTKNDGILTGLEVLRLNLTGTKLVVLSACETGVGDIQTGNGVYSLSRSFQEAGAKVVLSSLWSISDDGTEAFMNIFYKHYLKGVSAQKALQKTQLEFIESTKWNHPFYWAAFTMAGRK